MSGWGEETYGVADEIAWHERRMDRLAIEYQQLKRELKDLYRNQAAADLSWEERRAMMHVV